MKKVLFMLAFAGLTMAANAQLILGGQFGFNTNGGTNTNEVAPVFTVPNTKTMNLTIAPTISYVLNDNMQVGVSLGYGMTSTTNYGAGAYAMDKEAWAKNTWTTFGVAPYFRYYFAQAGNFNFFCQAELGFYLTPRTKTHNYDNSVTPVIDDNVNGAWSQTTLALTIVPGVNYKFNDNWSADCFINLAGLAFTHTTFKTFGVPGDPDKLTNTDVDNTFNLMANMSAQDLNAHLGNFSIGFNYHF